MKVKTISIIFFSLFFTLSLLAQDGMTRKEKRAARKALAIKESDSLRKVQEEWVKQKTFVLQASQVYNRIGDVFQITPSVNFVYFNIEDAVVQLSFDGLVGWNGIGGITVKGKIIKYKFDDTNKSKPIYIQATIQGSEGFQDIVVWVSSNGNGEAQVTDIRGNRIKFTGQIISLKEANIFTGTTRF